MQINKYIIFILDNSHDLACFVIAYFIADATWDTVSHLISLIK